MRILIVTDNRFWRQRLGSQRRIDALCSHLRARGHRLQILFIGALAAEDQAIVQGRAFPYTLVASAPDADAPAAAPPAWPRTIIPTLKRFIKQAVIELGRLLQGRRNRAAGPRRWMLQLREPKLRDFVSPGALAAFDEACRRLRPEGILIEYVRLAYLLRDPTRALSADYIKLIDTHDVQYERQGRFHAQGEVHDLDITPAEEASALARADAVLAIQPVDAAKFQTLVPGHRILVVGHPGAVTRQPDPGGAIVRIGFVGSDMTSNVNAALRLIDRLWPPLRQAYGETIALHLFGSVCDRLTDTAPQAGVTLAGFVDDLAAAYGAMHVIASPMEFGGGLKIKNVEALCCGKPLVTTPCGAEGLEGGAGTAFLVGLSDAELCEMLARLITDADRRSALGEAAARFAAKRFSAAAVFRELDDYLDRHAGRTDWSPQEARPGCGNANE